jgi:hypothetical protein
MEFAIGKSSRDGSSQLIAWKTPLEEPPDRSCRIEIFESHSKARYAAISDMRVVRGSSDPRSAEK